MITSLVTQICQTLLSWLYFTYYIIEDAVIKLCENKSRFTVMQISDEYK